MTSWGTCLGWSRWSGIFADRLPAAYRPGVTLERAVRELSAELGHPVDRQGALLVPIPAGGTIPLRVVERVERHFLMHMVGVELSMAVPAPSVPAAVIEIRNTGVVKRTGIACRSRSGAPGVPALIGSLESDPELVEALMLLDFRRIELRGGAGGWEVMIEPYGACEVVNSMPSFRRYVRLGPSQARLLPITFLALRRVIMDAALA